MHLTQTFNEIVDYWKRDYFSRKFDRCTGNPKGTWKLLISSTSRKQKSKGAPRERLIKGVEVNDPKEIAEAFDDYFSEAGENLEAQIPIVDTSLLRYMGESQQSSFFAAASTPHEVEIIIKNLNCRSGHPYVNPHKIFIKSCKITEQANCRSIEQFHFKRYLSRYSRNRPSNPNL